MCAPLRVDSWKIWIKFHRSTAEYVDVRLYNVFTRRYIALTAIVKSHIGSPKNGSERTNLCTSTSHTGSIFFFKISLELLCTWGIVVVHLYCGFCLQRQMATQQTAKFRTAGQFRSNSRNNSVVNYALIWSQFLPFVREQDAFCNALNVS